MIQRIQSILLLGIVTAMVSLLFFPIWHIENPETKESVLVTAQAIQIVKAGTTETKSTIFITILAIVASGIAGYSIFQYKKRTFQLFLGIINSLVIMAGLGVMWYTVEFSAKNIIVSKIPAKFGLGFFMPAICMLLNMLSSRFIRRDEKLVNSADRIR